MNWLKENTPVKNSFIIFSFLFFLIGFLTICYWFEWLSDPKWPAIISGLLTGFVVALFQTVLSLRELQKLDKYKAMKIKDVLQRKDNIDAYGRFLSTAKKKIWMQGVTADTFLEDFADMKSSREDGRVLLEVLGRGVDVRILVASSESLADDDKRHKNKAEMAAQRLKTLSDQFVNFKYAYYNHLPMHSILTVDNTSIVGPIFPGVSSKNTPAIHLENDSAFVEHYLEYFRNEWKEWSKDKEILKD